MMIITQKITSLAFEIHDGKISLSCLKLSFIFFYSFFWLKTIGILVLGYRFRALAKEFQNSEVTVGERLVVAARCDLSC